MFHYFIFLELLHHMCLLYHMPLTISKCFLTCFKIIFRLSSFHIFYGFHLFRNYKIFTCLVFQNVLTVLNTIYQPVFLNNFLGNFLFILSFFFQNVTSFWAHISTYFIHFQICPSLWVNTSTRGLFFHLSFLLDCPFPTFIYLFSESNISNVPFSFSIFQLVCETVSYITLYI